ncbi:tRNA pseudouridine(13) synthase TruD [Candidatus Bathyarchaeota archaeon]|nr:tRNA pseudouridine(13) synthase TruD [Candidatus Bathyarchaeota archaeon]
MDNSLDLPYITAAIPGVGGKIRATIDNFIVEEIPLYQPDGYGQHLYVNLTKRGLTTHEVQLGLARLFSLRVDDVGFAGLKDKYACATQTFSILVGKVDYSFVDQAVAQIRRHLPVTVNWARLHRNKLRPGHLLGNRFTVLITELDLPPDGALHRARSIVERLRGNGIPNFFGPQRFGLDGENVKKGFEIIKGSTCNADRWLRRFLISSYQSYLCNLYLARRLQLGLFERILAGDIAKKYATGGLFEVLDASREQARYESHEISFTAPIYGRKMWTASGPAGKLEKAILEEAGLTMKQFDAAGMRGSRRLGRLLLPDLTVTADPQGLLVSFSLPKGAFATTVLRELMKVELSLSGSSSISL